MILSTSYMFADTGCPVRSRFYTEFRIIGLRFVMFERSRFFMSSLPSYEIGAHSTRIVATAYSIQTCTDLFQRFISFIHSRLRVSTSPTGRVMSNPILCLSLTSRVSKTCTHNMIGDIVFPKAFSGASVNQKCLCVSDTEVCVSATR